MDSATRSKALAIGIVIGALVLAAGSVVAGYLAGRGVLMSRLEDRYVTVKGVAEMEMKADLATLPIRFSITAGDLKAGMGTLDESAKVVTGYLKEQKFKDDEITLQRVEIQDTLAQGYRNDVNKNARFILTQNVLVRSNDIEQVRKVSREIGELARRGVVLNDTPGPNFIVTAEKLNEIKPGLIRQATERAKVAADEFAQTSGSKVGGIRRANQGVIVILARDESPFEGEYQAVDKRIRAVTTVDYFLAKN
ncbi:MAG: SIMPL domain-containing protein [Alphaproteobacteria bacterium]